MGEIVSISIGEYEFFSSKNSFGELLTIFSKNDLHSESIITDDVNFTRRYLTTTVLKAKQVLDALGYTLRMSRSTFNSVREKWIYFYDIYDLPDIKAQDIDRDLTYEAWSDAVKKYALIVSKCVGDIETEIQKQRDEPHNIAEEIVLNSLPYFSDDTFFGVDSEVWPWEIFRVILDGFPEEQEILLDYTNLSEGGYCDEIPEDELFDVPKTIILTEGTFDAQIISKSMRLLYPHMSKIYSLIDFENVKVQGSCSYLTHYLKAFIGAKIENRIIALYDNDTAGLAEMKLLESIKIPSNVRIMHLPNLDICKSYPTIGPSRNEDADINGRACSIELFLGKDVLTENKKLLPIMWTGYNHKLKSYQGVITKKEDIQKRFEKKISNAEKNGLGECNDWDELKILLNSIFNAFNN